MKGNPNIEVVESYLAAIRDKNLEAAPFADDVTFEDPLTEKLEGKADVLGFLSGFLPAINGVTVHRHIAEGEFVATLWEADTVFGVIPIFECFRVVDGKIVSAQAFHDPRPIIGGSR